MYGLKSIASCKVINYKKEVYKTLQSKFVKAIINHYEWQQPMQNDLLSLRKHNNKYSKQNISKDSKVSKCQKTMIKLLAISIIAK